MAEARNVVFFMTKCASKMGKGSSANGRARDDKFMLGSWSNRPSIGRNNSRIFR